MKLCSLSLLQESFQFFRRVANLQAEPECHSQKLFSLPLPPCMGVSHQVTQAVLQFSVFCLNLRINIAKGKHISFYSASRGKARSRKGTEMKDVTTGGTRPPADEQTIPRIARKYFQPCGRAGQGGLPCSHTQCAVTLSVMGILKKHQIQLAEGSKLSMVSSSPDCLHCVYWGSSRQGAAGFLWQLSSCVHSGTELSPSGTDSLQHTDLQGSRFQGPVGGGNVLPSHSLPAEAPVCWELQLSHCATCIPRPPQDRGDGRKDETLVSPPKPLSPEGSTSVWVPVPSVRSGNHTEAGEVEWNYLPSKCSWEI